MALNEYTTESSRQRRTRLHRFVANFFGPPSRMLSEVLTRHGATRDARVGSTQDASLPAAHLVFEAKSMSTQSSRRSNPLSSMSSFSAFPNRPRHPSSARTASASPVESGSVAIARALYRKPSIPIFDDGTSAVDTVIETARLKAIETLKGGYTVIPVAHRLSTGTSCPTTAPAQPRLRPRPSRRAGRSSHPGKRHPTR